jgi:ParB family transcriptional regulator, chromosome partitioning protein
MKAATLQVALLDGFMESGRRLLAWHIGIDLSKEWVFTQEYLHKKTIAEMLGMGERLGIFSDPKARQYLSDTLKKKDFSKCKKAELIQVFLESGADLTGKVPEEIMG